jgi:tetratricopeptide (TPR) repeat protein
MSRKPEKKSRQGNTASSRPGGGAPPGLSYSRRDWLLAFLLAIGTFLAYQQVWRAGFIWDDDGHVTSADLRSLHGLWRIWSEPGATQQYYPVLHSAFWLEHRLWGDSPLGYHLANIVLHAAAALLLHRVLRALAVPGAWLGAAVFALHPVCVESVAWISEQKNTLSAVFYLTAALAYLRYDRERRITWYAGAIFLFGLALASKSVTVTLPAALLVVSWWTRGRLAWRGDVLPLLPWFALAAGAGAVTVWMERAFIGAKGAAFALSLADRFLIAGRAVWFYSGKLVWPADLTFIYPRWNVDDHAAWQYLFPVAAGGVLAALFAIRTRTRGPLAAALLFIGTLFPALGFINVYPFVYSFVADHFQYLAAAVVISAAAAGVTLGADRLPAGSRLAVRVASIGVVAVCAALTWSQGAMYAEARTLWQTTLARNPDCWMACDNLGNDFLGRGQTDEAVLQFQRALALRPGDDFAENNLGLVLLQKGQLDAAGARFESALRINPDNAEAHNNLGLVLGQKGKTEQAIVHFERAVALKERYPAAHYNLGAALLRDGQTGLAIAQFQNALASEPESAEIHTGLGAALLKNGQGEEAIAHYRTALALKDDYAEAHFKLGDALLQGGRVDEAVVHYRRGLEIDPAFARARVNLAHALLQKGEGAEAEEQFRKALEVEPDDAEANNDLGVVLLQKDQVDAAVAQFQRALAANATYTQAHFNLANIFLQRGEFRSAIDQYQKTLETEPGNARAQNNLGLALLQSRRDDEAVAHFQRALEIDPGYAQARRNLDAALARKP